MSNTVDDAVIAERWRNTRNIASGLVPGKYYRFSPEAIVGDQNVKGAWYVGCKNGDLLFTLVEPSHARRQPAIPGTPEIEQQLPTFVVDLQGGRSATPSPPNTG